MKKKKILIVLADVANGHRSAANAIEKVFEIQYHNQYDVKSLDLFAVADIEPFNTSDTSHKLVSQNKVLESMYNGLFQLTNTNLGYGAFCWYINSRMHEACKRILEDENPDLVISVHPIISIIIKAIKEETNKFKSVTVITDLITLSKGWADTSADLLISPTKEAIQTLVNFGVSSDKIVSPLFPINPNMRNSRPKEVVLKELQFNEDKPIIMITGGGIGSRSLKSAIDNIVNRGNVQTIVIAGRLESFKKEMDYKYGNNPQVKILGFVNNMQDYLNVVDIVVGKPGPATVIEIEIFDKKAILTKKVGIQESGNIDYALKNPKFRYIGEDWNKLNSTIDELMNLDEKEVKQEIRRYSDECLKIIEESLKLID